MTTQPLSEQIGILETENKLLRAGLKAVYQLMRESHGVTGLHLNGDVAPWDELLQGGRFEQWLIDFSLAMEHGEVKF
jgi:hypothetical protein